VPYEENWNAGRFDGRKGKRTGKGEKGRKHSPEPKNAAGGSRKLGETEGTSRRIHAVSKVVKVKLDGEAQNAKATRPTVKREEGGETKDLNLVKDEKIR